MSEQEDFAKAASLFASKPAVEAAEKDMFADSDGDDMFADSDAEGADKPKHAAEPRSVAAQSPAAPADASAAEPTADMAAGTGAIALHAGQWLLPAATQPCMHAGCAAAAL
jgi:hypothetical protein